MCEDPRRGRERTTSLWLALGPQADKGVDWFSKPFPPPYLPPVGHFKSETWSSSLECGAVLSAASQIGNSLLMNFLLLFSLLAISREDGDDTTHHHHHHNHHRGGGSHHNHGNKVPYNGYNSEEYLDRLEPNGNIPADKTNCRYGGKFFFFFSFSTSTHFKEYITRTT